jgi:hypothetical protein
MESNMMRLIITISEEEREQANAFMKENIDLEGGEFTFLEGQVEANGNFTEEQAELIRSNFDNVVEA